MFEEKEEKVEVPHASQGYQYYVDKFQKEWTVGKKRAREDSSPVAAKRGRKRVKFSN